MNTSNNLVVGFYYHPEAYPPTLNALEELADCFEHITVVHRNHLETVWHYPENVKTIPSGARVSVNEQLAASTSMKFIFFVKFVRDFFSQCRKARPRVILVADPISLYAYACIKRFLTFKHSIWYHNHDVTEPSSIRKYSISWLASRAEQKAFAYLDIFSLPADERRRFFPMDIFKGRYFSIPNYPSKKFYGSSYSSRKIETSVRILYQGSVAPDRGFEEVLPLLQEVLQGHSLELGLLGPCSKEYKEKIIHTAERLNVSDQIFFGSLPYIDLPKFSATYHIGLGILAGNSIMHSTVGTAANKIYEYAALGLPVIYYNRPNFTTYLAQFNWAFPAELSTDSIREAIIKILGDYTTYSQAAHYEFLSRLNFETAFSEIKSFLYTTGSTHK